MEENYLNDIDEEWENFCDGDYNDEFIQNQNTIKEIDINETPKCSEVYISTKTRLAFLNSTINLKHTFWNIPITPYYIQKCGVIKKQMKFNSTSQDELDEIRSHIPDDIYTNEYIIQQIINPNGKIKFKDIRKISIGINKKDITSYRCKQKGAFYNCFAVYVRIKYEGIFKEIHVKVFNTGKLELPGIKNDEILNLTLIELTKVLKPIISPDKELTWDPNNNDTVLINSNFSCNYNINREKLFNILKYKYQINTIYDPCSYPGTQSKFYYDTSKVEQDGKQPTDYDPVRYKKVSFMIFRTGSVMIVGKCSNLMLNNIYNFLKQMLENEYINISNGNNVVDDEPKKNKNNKNKKNRKKIIVYS